ncbi:hypothetical protein [Methyloprofundus sp.]|uniref:hypothetical protein n=1 Tax=Methyloprofundus sp. TaxID=2020875 RepID=UPI003D0A6F6B
MIRNEMYIIKSTSFFAEINKRLQSILILSFITMLVGCASTGSVTSTGDSISNIESAFKKGNVRLTCGISCSGSYGAKRNELKGFYENELWDDLANVVAISGHKGDQEYYYLGRAAEGLGYYLAAQTYYKLALADAYNCDGIINNCDGLVFPRDAEAGLQRLTKIANDAQASHKALDVSNATLEARYEILQKDQEALKRELDEYKYGAERTIAEVNKAYDEKDYARAKQNIAWLSSKHPESPYNAKFKKLLKKIEKKEREEEKINKEKEQERERIRLENLKKTGMWSVQYYVDEFGEDLKEGYIVNTTDIDGRFSNSVSDNSTMKARILISNASEISIKIYQYGYSLVQGGGSIMKSELFVFKIQDNDGNKFEISSRNQFDRFTFREEYSLKLHNALMKGGKLKFFVTDITPSTHGSFDYIPDRYFFVIENADFYQNSYKILMDMK